MPALEQLRQHRPARALDVHPAAADEVLERLRRRGPGRRGSGSSGGPRPRPGRSACRRPGTRSGTSYSRASAGRFSRIGRTTSGMTSPAFWRTTVSPIRMSLRRTSSRLWSVARATVEPATFAGTQVRDRGQRPGPPDVRDDVLDDRLDLLRRELVGDRPAWRPADHPEARLLVEAVDLDHHAVRLVRQVVALLAPRLGERDHALDVEPGLTIGVDREAERVEPCRAPPTGCRRPARPRRAGTARSSAGDPRSPAGSFWRSDPAPLLRGLAYSGRPASSRSALIRANSALGMNTSPRASSVAGSARRSGIARIVRRLGVTSSPVRAVAAGRADREPSALVAQRDGEAVDLELRDVRQARPRAPARPRGRGRVRTRVSNARSSSWLNAFDSDSIGRWWRTSGNRPPAGAPPTFWVGDSGVTRAGNAASRATSRRNSWSYSASESSGASSSW